MMVTFKRLKTRW